MKAKIRNPKQANWVARRARGARGGGTSDPVDLTGYRSLKHRYAHRVEPTSGGTNGAVATRAQAGADGLQSTSNIEAAKRVGTAIAALAKEKNIEKVVFNRNGFLYHGRVKAIADAAREAGLEF
jgi:large subunit ribosomal protein L18